MWMPRVKGAIRRLVPGPTVLIVLALGGLLLIGIVTIIWWLHIPESLCASWGSRGGDYFVLGQQLLDVLQSDFEGDRTDKRVRFQCLDDISPSRGTVENLKRIVQGKVQVALAMEGFCSDTDGKSSQEALNACRKDGLGLEVRGLAQLSDSTLHIVLSQHMQQNLNRRLESLSDIIDEPALRRDGPLKVYVGAEGSGTLQAVHWLLRHYRVDPLKEGHWSVVPAGSYDEAAEQFTAGKIDLAFFFVRVGAKAIEKVATQGTLLSLRGLVEGITTRHPFLKPTIIPPGTYNEAFPRHKIETLTADNILIVSSDLDKRVAYRIVRSIASHWHDLNPGVHFTEDFNKTQLAANDYYSLHPGALAYYKGENIPLWPWFNKIWNFFVKHRDVFTSVTSVIGIMGSGWPFVYRWFARRRVRNLLRQASRIATSDGLDEKARVTIRIKATQLLAEGKIDHDGYEVVTTFARECLAKQESSACP